MTTRKVAASHLPRVLRSGHSAERSYGLWTPNQVPAAARRSPGRRRAAPVHGGSDQNNLHCPDKRLLYFRQSWAEAKVMNSPANGTDPPRIPEPDPAAEAAAAPNWQRTLFVMLGIQLGMKRKVELRQISFSIDRD